MVIYFAANLYSTIDNVYIGLSRLDIRLYIYVYIYCIYKVSACRYSIYVLFWWHTYIVSANMYIMYIYTYIYIPFKMSTMMRRFRKKRCMVRFFEPWDPVAAVNWEMEDPCRNARRCFANIWVFPKIKLPPNHTI